MTLVRFALRAHRVGFLAATGIACLNAILQATGYVQIAGETPEARIQFARTMELLGRQLSVMLPVPVELETLAGFLQWRHAGSLPLVYGLWALLAGTGVGRGDEERGVVEQWLAAGVSRLRYLATRLVVFTAIATVSAALTLAATGLGARLVGVDLPASGLAAQAIALVALALACFAIALVAAQMVETRRAAGGLGGILLLVLFLLNGASRPVGDLVPVARPTP
ncbi:MAG: ABC transporter permease, partial [Chloroflexota bacterium]